MPRAPLLCVAVLALLEACSASGPVRSATSSISDADLLSGNALELDLTVPPPPISPDDAFALDDEMRAFATQFRYLTNRHERLRQLLDAMERRGLFSLAYKTSATRTVRETFHEHQGNCLSFTMLFVTLAREAGLTASYQVVDVPPSWSYDVDLVVVGNHVNATVGMPFETENVIDFNVSDFRGHYPTRRVADNYAVALYYTNLGAEALLRKDYAQTFVLLREAIQLAPDLAEPWVDLGVLYGRRQRLDYAEAAYLRALQAEPGERSALANLVGVYTALGNDALAAEYRDRVRRYQESNPFYHYALAQAAYDEGRYADALASARRAIRIKHDEPAFQSLQQRALAALGRDRGTVRAAPSTERAPLATFDPPPVRTVSGRLDSR